MWKVASARISVLLYTSWYIMKSYIGSSIQLPRKEQSSSSIFYREKIIEGGVMEGSSKEVIGY